MGVTVGVPRTVCGMLRILNRLRNKFSVWETDIGATSHCRRRGGAIRCS